MGFVLATDTLSNHALLSMLYRRARGRRAAILGWDRGSSPSTHVFLGVRGNGLTAYREVLSQLGRLVVPPGQVERLRAAGSRFEIVANVPMPPMPELKMVAFDEATPRYSGPPVGRNAPCPCNSGKKFKSCCRP